MIEDEFETTQEAAQRLELSESYIRKLLARGRLCGIKRANTWFVRRGVALDEPCDDLQLSASPYETVREVGQRLGYDRTTVLHMIYRGQLPATRSPWRSWILPRGCTPCQRREVAP